MLQYKTIFYQISFLSGLNLTGNSCTCSVLRRLFKYVTYRMTNLISFFNDGFKNYKIDLWTTIRSFMISIHESYRSTMIKSCLRKDCSMIKSLLGNWSLKTFKYSIIDLRLKLYLKINVWMMFKISINNWLDQWTKKWSSIGNWLWDNV